MLDIIIAWIIDPILDILEHRHTSGRWNVSHLLPVATIACVGICRLAERWSSIILLVFGGLGAAMFGLLSLVLWIPREVEAYRDQKSYLEEKKKKAAERTNAEGAMPSPGGKVDSNLADASDKFEDG